MKKRTERIWLFEISLPGLAAIFLLSLPISSGLPGCKKEGKKVREAYEKVFKYRKQLTGREAEIVVRRKLPKDVWRVRDNREVFNRPRLEVELDMPYNAAPARIKKRLQKITTLAKAGTAYKAVRVRAWPKHLRRYAGIMGVSVLSPDGGGWAGERVGYRQLKITISKDKGAAPPTRFEYGILLEIERLHWKLMENKRYAALDSRSPEKFEQMVIKKVAETRGLTAASLAKMVDKARSYYLQVPF